MIFKSNIKGNINWHKITLIVVLCLFGFGLLQSRIVSNKKAPKKMDERVYLIHADNLSYDVRGKNPTAQIVKGHVSFSHRGGYLWCDSAYFFQVSNSVKAFGNVRFKQGDTLSLRCDRAFYDGQVQLIQARKNVILKHRAQTLLTDSLDFDRLYNYAYFREGGTLIDGKDRLVADWGEYNTKTRQSTFYYNVKLRTSKRIITTDTLYYDAAKSLVHVVGPSKVISGTNVINTKLGYFNTKSDNALLYGRSTIVDKDKTITGDSLFYNDKTKIDQGYGNVIYVDKKNKNALHCGRLFYNGNTGYGYATRRAITMDYSHKDTLYAHADTFKIYTFNINTDSVFRKVHAYHKVRAYRVDMQAVCDSMVFNSKDSCMTMYKGPIVWNENRQILGDLIKVFVRDSTIHFANVIGNALSIEMMPDKKHYNQLSSKEMKAYFTKGNLRRTEAIGNVISIYYPVNKKDSAITALNYLETDTMKMYLSSERKLSKIWASKSTGTSYPMTQIPPGKDRLMNFAWYDNVRPRDKNDILIWRDKNAPMSISPPKKQHTVPAKPKSSPVSRTSSSRAKSTKPKGKS